MTPVRVSKMSRSYSSSCWRCGQDTCSMLHRWWTCSLIQQFWLTIHHEITSVIGLPLNFSPLEYFLHLCLNLDKSDTIFLNNVLVAAKVLITKKWKTVNVPTLHEWHMKKYFLVINKITAIKSA